MTKSFRPWRVDEIWLLPPSVQEFVPAGHPAHLIRDIVREELDLSAILSTYTEARGFPPYDPGMMVALLLYTYSQGVYSSRRIARGCEEQLDFQAVTALNQPDFRTISEFHRRHLTALGDLFVQVLALCQQAGLVGLSHIAVDGTKLRANASKHKAMSYERMIKAEGELAAAAKEAARPETVVKADGTPSKRRGPKPTRPSGTPEPTTQRNFTDPESRIMLGRDGFIQAYNGRPRWTVSTRSSWLTA